MSLEIELQDRKIEVEVLPLEAAILELFSTKDTWTVADLASEMKLEKAVVRKALSTWVEQGVLKEADTEVYELLEVAEAAPSGSKPAARSGVFDLFLCFVTCQ